MKTIGIIGLGNMGMNITKNITELKKYFIHYHDKKKKNVKYLFQKELSDLIINADILIIAVKPQNFLELRQDLFKFTRSNQTIISIMAGVNLTMIKKFIKSENLVRVMPNLAIKEKASLNGYILAEKFNKNKIKEIKFLLSSWGKNIQCQNEEQIDIITTVSGSGLALYYIIADYFINFAAKKFSKKQALIIIKQVMLGAALHSASSPTMPLALVKQIASKGGTTETAIKYYQKNNLKNLFVQGLQMAQDRSQELNKIIKQQFIYEYSSRKKINLSRK